MRKTIFFRNFFSTAAIVFVSFVMLGAVFASLSYRYMYNSRRDEMSHMAQEATNNVSALSSMWTIDSLEIKMMLTMMSNMSGNNILLTDTSGIVVSCSDNYINCMHMGKQVPTNVLYEAYWNDGGYINVSTKLGGIYSSAQYVVAMPVFSGNTGSCIGYILTSNDRSSMLQLWRGYSGVLLLVAIVVLEITFIITFITTKRTTRPLNQITKAVVKFTRGDLSSRVEVSGEDEVGQLADSFNLMADTLERSETRRREFVANVSHELKTPMTTISGFADGILDGTIPKEKEMEYIAVISSETHRLSRLVRGMLDMSQLTAKDPAVIRSMSFDITELIYQALLSLEQKINGKGLDVDVECPEEHINTLGDRDATTQVVYNLIDNAVKFSKEGGTLKVSLWKKGVRAYVSVENQGDTIPPEELPLIFDRFHKTDKSRSTDKEGVGLGLYIVKTILDNHREDIFVTSDNGTTAFTFTLTIDQRKTEK